MSNDPINWDLRLKERRIDETSTIKEDRIYFIIDDNIIGTAGNFITFSGLPKAGKSTFISALISSHISKRDIFSFKVFSYMEKNRIALFDTEQSPYDFNRSIKRIKNLSGAKDIFKNFDAFLCREDSSFEILKLIYTYLKSTPECSVLIIDGILDCVDNFNDEGASKKLIRYLKKWSSMFECLIVTILHTSKGSGQTLGHYGSASDRYSQSTLNIEKSKEGTFICSPKFLRSSKDFNPIEIKYNEQLKTFIQL